MLKVSPQRKRTAPEPTIALINIVFLMLIFFLIAGTLAPPIPPDLKSVSSEEAPPSAPPDALAVSADGSLTNRNQPVSLEAFVVARNEAIDGPVRIISDRALPARQLLEIVDRLKAAGASEIVLITERRQ